MDIFDVRASIKIMKRIAFKFLELIEYGIQFNITVCHKKPHYAQVHRSADTEPNTTCDNFVSTYETTFSNQLQTIAGYYGMHISEANEYGQVTRMTEWNNDRAPSVGRLMRVSATMMIAVAEPPQGFKTTFAEFWFLQSAIICRNNTTNNVRCCSGADRHTKRASMCDAQKLARIR